MATIQSQLPNLTTIDAFWNVYIANMNVGRRTDLTMPITLKTVIGQEGIRIMETRFRNMIEAPVTVTENSEEGLIRIAPARNPRGHERVVLGIQGAKPRASNKSKIARPPNAFILYRQHHHPLVKAEYPNLHNNQISVILGAQWKQEPDVNKAKFAALASRLKAKHLQEHPGYQYQPRKPSEKKRRQTRKIGRDASVNKSASSGLTSTSTLTSQAKHDDVYLSNSGASVLQINPASTVAPPTTCPLVTTLDIPAAAIPAGSLPSLGSGPANVASLASSDGLYGSPREISRTATGNAVFEFGSEDLDEDQLAIMLAEYNKTVPAAPTPQADLSRRLAPPVLYSEPTEDAQNDANFYSAMVEFDNFLSTPTDFGDLFDFQAASLQNPEFQDC